MYPVLYNGAYSFVETADKKKGLIYMDVFELLNDVPEIIPSYDDLTVYDAAFKPVYNIQKYVRRVYLYMIDEMATMRAVFHYMALFRTKTGIAITLYNAHRVFLAAAMAAHKFWDDDCLSNKKISKIGGVSLYELNIIEEDFLRRIHYELYLFRPVTDNDVFVKSSVMKQSIQKIIYGEPDARAPDARAPDG
jgi:hypothetical protein